MIKQVTRQDVDGMVGFSKLVFSPAEKPPSAEWLGGVCHLVKNHYGTLSQAHTHSTLTKGEVRGGGAKPYKQKGTGRARRGSSRTPLRVGGGVVFGPRPRVVTSKLNRKFLTKSVHSFFEAQLGFVYVVDESVISVARCGELSLLIAKVAGRDAKSVLIGESTASLVRFGRNLSASRVVDVNRANLVDFVEGGRFVFVSSSVFSKFLERFHLTCA